MLIAALGFVMLLVNALAAYDMGGWSAVGMVIGGFAAGAIALTGLLRMGRDL